MSAEIVPFGKYKGQPVDVLTADQDYCEWLVSQPWFKSRYGNVYNILIQGGGEPQDSPEHNEMQARFLEDDWCLRLAAVLTPRLADGYEAAAAREQMKDSPLYQEFRACTEETVTPASIPERAFEVGGWDVEFMLKPSIIRVRVLPFDRLIGTLLPPCTCECDHTECSAFSGCGGDQDWTCRHKGCTEVRGTEHGQHCTTGCPWAEDGDMQRSVKDVAPESRGWGAGRGDVTGDVTKAHWLRYGLKKGHRYGPDRIRRYGFDDEPFPFRVELKPDLGDDYPAVLRQVTGYRYPEGSNRCVVARRYAFESVTWDQVRKIFAASGITLVAESELRAAAGSQ